MEEKTFSSISVAVIENLRGKFRSASKTLEDLRSQKKSLVVRFLLKLFPPQDVNELKYGCTTCFTWQTWLIFGLYVLNVVCFFIELTCLEGFLGEHILNHSCFQLGYLFGFNQIGIFGLHYLWTRRRYLRMLITDFEPDEDIQNDESSVCEEGSEDLVPKKKSVWKQRRLFSVFCYEKMVHYFNVLCYGSLFLLFYCGMALHLYDSWQASRPKHAEIFSRLVRGSLHLSRPDADQHRFTSSHFRVLLLGS